MTSAARSLVWVDRRSVIVDSIRCSGAPAPFFGATSAAWRTTGGRIAFAAAGPLWLFDRTARSRARPRPASCPGREPSTRIWSPGDSLIAYRTLFSGTLMLRLHHLETDTSDSLFASGMRNFRTPDWSPTENGSHSGSRPATPRPTTRSGSTRCSIGGRLGLGPGRQSLGAALVARRAMDGLRLGRDRRARGVRPPGVRIVGGAAGLNAGGDFPYWR